MSESAVSHRIRYAYAMLFPCEIVIHKWSLQNSHCSPVLRTFEDK